MSDQMRSEFENNDKQQYEETGRDFPSYRTLASGSYAVTSVHCRWQIWQKAWQASRASLCVELPELFDKRDVQGLDYDATVEAITKTGVRVK